MTDNLRALEQLEGIVSGLLSDLSPSGRAGLMRKVAKSWAKSQGARIGRQKNPDGSSYERRKARRASMGQYAVKFLYPEGGSGDPRVVMMKSWKRDGPLFTGFDVERGAIRSFEWTKVIKWLAVSPGEQNKNAGVIGRRVTLKQGAMFKGLRKPRFLRSGANEREAWVGFVGGVAAVARVHQEGLKDRAAKDAPEVEYPMRELLGMSQADREALLDLVLQHLEG